MKYFYVYQNKTYYEEMEGGFLWSPKFAKGWRLNPGYEAMKEVVPGDIIFHSYQGNIVAISVARSSCYTYPRPSLIFSQWANDGWKIDADYYILRRQFNVGPYIPELYDMQPQNGPFRSDFKGKQQYLCNVNKKMFDYLIEKILLQSESEGKRILDFLKTIPANEPIIDIGEVSNTPKEISYVLCPICELNYVPEGQKICESCLKKSK